MKKLSEILDRKEEIETLSRKFRFKNIRLFFENIFPMTAMPLNLIVDIDHEKNGNANYTSLLEAKLMKELQIKVIIMASSKIVDPFKIKQIESGSIPLSAPVKEIKEHVSNIHWQHSEDWDIESFEEDPIILERRLKLGEKILLENMSLAENAPSVFNSGKRKYPENMDTIDAETALNVLLDPNNQKATREILKKVLTPQLWKEIMQDFAQTQSNTTSAR